jgi:hypothetical protein
MPARPPLQDAAPAAPVTPPKSEAHAPPFRPQEILPAKAAARPAGIVADDRGPRPTGSPEAGASPFTPLSAATIAGRLDDARRAEPVIHVTIDRIEVRAPAPSRPAPAPAARRAPAEPSMSLADFLAAGPARPRP